MVKCRKCGTRDGVMPLTVFEDTGGICMDCLTEIKDARIPRKYLKKAPRRNYPKWGVEAQGEGRFRTAMKFYLDLKKLDSTRLPRSEVDPGGIELSDEQIARHARLLLKDGVCG